MSSENKFDCGIINTGAGNLTSLSQAINRIGSTSIIINNTKEFRNNTFDKIIIPGQGRFGTVMQNLNSTSLDAELEQWHQQDKPIFGICVGMQIFFESSDEDPNAKGFCWLKGKAKSLEFPKRPMVGWCEVGPNNEDFPKGIAYFVNSFAIPKSDACIAQSEYGELFCSAVKRNHLVGVQFHPEKSAEYGLEVIKQCLDF